MSLPVTEDTPPDMLAGSMDLKVILPDGHSVKMSVQRSTPMMDLLVQVTTAHCLSPGDYSLQAIGDKTILPFKPSTPIGVLDTFAVKVVEKKLNVRGRVSQVPQSFLNTFRLQVHLPRSQLFVIRVTPDVTLSEIMTHICTEKNLNLEKYEFRNPGNLEEVLDLDKTLGDYKLHELSMMSKGNRTVTGLMSSADMINVKSSKHRQNSVCDSSLSSGSYGSRSGSPVPAINVVTMPPQPPIRKKRRPAPKPPSFVENEKKEQNTGSVLISHSRESSDSSGYHEASVLSESPTHGRPAGRIDNDSPPDTLPRHGKLPPSQSFTNLTSIQPTPRSQLTNSASNTSLNSNGHPRKKRAPPPPPVHISREDKLKSSTLPTSITEERRNGFINENNFRHLKTEIPVEVADTKVQKPVEVVTELVNETKASKDEVSASSLDVDNKLLPKPKPRTVVSGPEAKFHSQTNLESLDLTEGKSKEILPDSGRLNRWNNFENLTEEVLKEEDNVRTPKEENSSLGEESCSAGSSTVAAETVKNYLVSGSSEASEEPPPPPPSESQDLTDHDSINWEYQLPPPPTDFRDSHSPSCTEFGTITITPEVLENLGQYDKQPEEKSQKKCSQINDEKRTQENKNQNHHYCPLEKNFSQSKSEVMSELTNILNENRRCKEKSLSVNNLYVNDFNPKDLKKNALNYSRSFSIEPVSSLENFKLSTYQTNGLENNKKLSTSNEFMYNSQISYRNYKNLEKSASMECIQTNNSDLKIIEKADDVFRKPVAPVQKKLKVAKRSTSSIGPNTSNSQKRNSVESSYNENSLLDDANLNILREQFLEFLRQKKLMSNDISMKSLDVIRNVLPELNKEKDVRSNPCSHSNIVLNQSNETNTQGNAQLEPKKEEKRKEEAVKIVDMKIKSLPPSEDEVVLRHEGKKSTVTVTEVGKTLGPSLQEKKQEITKRYSYQGPPSINFSTWGERPKTTRIIIKDEDYVTQEKVVEKTKSENRNVDSFSCPKTKEVKKPAQIFIKKPGVMSHYEMFSALPRRKEVSSLELIHMEDEEKKKKVESNEAKEFNRVPIVCAMELKKEFKRVNSPPEPSVVDSEASKTKHSVSVYVNGNQDPTVDKDRITSSMPCYSFILPKRNSSLMPVVKGFRPLEEPLATNYVNISNSSNHININITSKKEAANEKVPVTRLSPSKRQVNGSVAPPPPPPCNISLVKLKPVSLGSGKSKPASQDPRGELLEEIRNFGGLRKLKKSTVCKEYYYPGSRC